MRLEFFGVMPPLKNLSAEQATEAAGSLCWRCQSAVAADAHFCPMCGRIQPAVAMDHFTFFGLPRKLEIDVPALEKEFYRLSRRLHPDVTATAAADEQRWGLEKSSQLNDAWRTLKDPIARTQYLLQLEGARMEEQSASRTGATVPPELLEEVFELNMQLQQMRAAGSADPGLCQELEAAEQRFQEMLAGVDAELKILWRQWDALSPSAADAQRLGVRDAMVALLNRRSYVRNLVRNVAAALEE